MINLTLYDYLEKVVNASEEELSEYQEQCGCDKDSIKLGINSLQSIIRSSVIEEQDQDPAYARVIYGKYGYESIKPRNMKFDLLMILSLLSDTARVLGLKDKLAIFMTIFSIISKLKGMKVELSSLMGIIVIYLYKNSYQKKSGRSIREEELLNRITQDYSEEIKVEDIKKEFYHAINSLDSLKVIEIADGKVCLIEEVTI